MGGTHHVREVTIGYLVSDTYHTRPGWIVEFTEGAVRHDHTRGTCRVETLDHARATAVNGRRHPASRCARWEWVTEPCAGHVTCSRAAWLLTERIEYARADHDDVTLRKLRAYGPHRPFRCAFDHQVRVYRPELHCPRCDELRDWLRNEPTCLILLDRRTSRRVFSDGMQPGTRQRWERLARARTRETLRAALTDYRAHGDTDIEPEPTRHRHVARSRMYW